LGEADLACVSGVIVGQGNQVDSCCLQGANRLGWGAQINPIDELRCIGQRRFKVYENEIRRLDKRFKVAQDLWPGVWRFMLRNAAPQHHVAAKEQCDAWRLKGHEPGGERRQAQDDESS